MSNHVGLLFNEPPGHAGLPFVQSADDFESLADRNRKLPYLVEPVVMLLSFTRPGTIPDLSSLRRFLGSRRHRLHQSIATGIGEDLAGFDAPEGRPFDPIPDCPGIPPEQPQKVMPSMQP